MRCRAEPDNSLPQFRFCPCLPSLGGRVRLFVPLVESPVALLAGLVRHFREALALLEERHPDGRGIKEFLRILTLKHQVGGDG